jgi:GH15 family glucan-1,4-alpha-glucosidase
MKASNAEPPKASSSRIEDYAIIGDCETAALVSRDGSIDWLCWPRFDSGACFAALLGTPDNGRWLIAPADADVRTSRRYRGDTLILETTHETAEGTVQVIDFMPLRGDNADLVRMVVGTHGQMAMRTEIVLRFDYGNIVPWVTRLDGAGIRAIAGPDMLMLHSDVEVHGEELKTVGDFVVKAGQTVTFVLTWGPSHLPPPEPVDAKLALEDTEKFWVEWTARCTYKGEWRDAVMRSLLTLKALTYRPTGGIVAAPTTSLPELIGGTRNWDYRYCWLRDATLTLLALMDAGYYDEAAAWRDWLLRAAAGSPSQLQIMYGLSGERHLREWEVPWLAGFEGSKPVRIGNAAHEQLQLDVYGEMMDALHQARLGGISENVEAWRMQRALTEHIAENWQLADHGIWEVRGAPQHFTHSKVMAWVAIDRSVKSAEKFNLEGPIEKWRALRETIHEEICRRSWNASIGSFVQAYDSSILDASTLLLPLVGFLPATDARIRSTVECIEKKLLVDGFVLRYDTAETDDGLPPGEGAFLACSFWLADNYVLLGRRDDARALFERLLALRNDLGLLAEEYDQRLGRQCGNFPQAFSHIALVDTAFNLGHPATQSAPKPTQQRASNSAK